MDYDCTACTSATGALSGCPGGAWASGAGTLANPYSFDYRGGLSHFRPDYGNVDVTSTNGWFLSQIRARQNYRAQQLSHRPGRLCLEGRIG
jgi:hypothetical protein